MSEGSFPENTTPGSGGFSRRAALAGGGAAMLATALAACGKSSEDASGDTGAGDFPKTPKYRFVFVNHVTTNPFFVPTQYGAQDASALLGTTFQWTGSKTANAGEMVNAMNTAISGNVDGIAVCLVDLKAFNGPTEKALEAGIPVLSYNADAPNDRLAYIGQDLFLSGVEMGKRIVELVPSGKVGLFIATPGSLNIQPRIDGAIKAIKDSGKSIEYKTVATGAELNEELSRIDAWYLGNKDAKGMFAVDAGSTQSVGQVIEKYKLRDKGVKGGGFDTLEKTLELLKADQLDFTIDQQAYLQGFFPVVQLFLTKISGSLTGPAGDEHGPEVRHLRRRRHLPQQPVALRGLHQGAEGDPERRVSTAATGSSPESPPAAPAAVSPGRTLWKRATELALGRRELSIAVVAIALYFYFLNAVVDFASTQNLQTLGTFIAATAIIAAGQVFLMISGEIDLSVGQVYALAAFMVYWLADAGLPILLCVVLALVGSALIGLVNGVITTVVGVSSFITTLGTFFLLNGLTLTLAGGRPVSTPGEGTYTKWFGGGAYAEILWAIGIVLVLQLLLMRTRWGLHTFAVGGNLLGSSEAGIKVRWVKTRNFMLASTLAGFAGIIEAVRITSTDPLAGGSSIMFQAISAAVIGGTLLAGGSGTVIGAFIGACVLGILRDGFTLQGVSAFTFDLILGAAILVAMMLEIYVGRLRLRGGAGG